MIAQIRSMACVVAGLLAAATLAACGGGSSSDSGGADKGDPAASHAAAEKLIEQAIARNPKASSGRIDGTIDVVVKGVPGFKGTTEVTASGTYDLPDGASVPDFDIDVGLVLNDGAIGGAIVLADRQGFIKLGNQGYKMPDAISRKLAEPAPAARNGLTKTAAMFYINPQDWQENAQLVGATSVAGESVQHIKADLQPKRFFLDMARLTRFLTLINVTQAVGLPQRLGPEVRAALERSVTVAKGEVWIGTADHVLRKARAQGKLVVAKRDRKLLSGMTSATLDVMVDITEVGEPHTIRAPTQLDPYSSLQLSLSALGEAVRRQTRGR